MLSIIIFASTLNTLTYDEKDLRIEDQPRSIYIVYDFIARYLFLLLLFLLEVSTDRGGYFSRGRDSIWKRPSQIFRVGRKKTCEEIKSVNPRRNFPPDSTSLRSILQHPTLSLFYPSLSLSLSVSSTTL